MIRWLSEPLVSIIHDELVAEHGGLRGLRDPELLASALARPHNLHAYEEADIYRLAAAYTSGIMGNHPFVDGNKRTAFMAMYVFLKLNGIELTASEPDVVHTMLQVASGKVKEERLAAWIRENSEEG